MAKLISQLCSESQPAIYLLVKGRWSHLKNTQALMDLWQASEISHSKSSLGNFQHQYLAE